VKPSNSESIKITAINRPSEVAVENYRKKLSHVIKELIKNKAS
jgi:hypothetical protein